MAKLLFLDSFAWFASVFSRLGSCPHAIFEASATYSTAAAPSGKFCLLAVDWARLGVAGFSLVKRRASAAAVFTLAGYGSRANTGASTAFDIALRESTPLAYSAVHGALDVVESVVTSTSLAKFWANSATMFVGLDNVADTDFKAVTAADRAGGVIAPGGDSTVDGAGNFRTRARVSVGTASRTTELGLAEG
jgi:hypothetical protein